jgi:HK97 family phage portal protein
MNLLARIKAAFTPEKFFNSSMTILRGEPAKRSPFEYRAAVNAYRSWIYAAANLNAVAVASQPLRLYVRNKSQSTKLWNTRKASRRTKAYLFGDLEQRPSRYALTKAAEYGDDFEVVDDAHPILQLLSKVNQYQNGFDATVLRVLYGELTGNAYIHPVIDQRLGIPVQLWTMPSQFVEVVPGQQGEDFVKAYRYGATEEQKRENTYAPDEVIHFKRPNPADMYYGIGKVEAAWGAIMANDAIHEMDVAFFANKARPDYLLVVKSPAHDDELERLEVSIDEKLRGSKRTGRFLTTTADIDLKPLSFPPKDLAGRDQIVEEIAAVFGVPVSMLKANDPNLASATVGFASWKQTTILPLLRMDEETLNQNLLPLFNIEEDAFLAYDNPVSEDEKFAFEKLRSMVAGGIMTANEARMREGLEPVEDPMADNLLVNGQPLGGPAPVAPLGMASSAPDGLTGPLDASNEIEEPPMLPTQPEQKDALSDCVSEKIPTLIEEGYPQDQAVAIAYSMCAEGKTLDEIETKAIGDIDTRPPQSVADNARRALEVRARKPESERGMTAVGIARARDLMNRVRLSEDTIRRMVSYFERHEVDKQGSTWDEQGKGWQAWNGWGGDDGFAWAKRKIEEFDRERERNSERKKKCACGCASKNGGGDPPAKPSERISGSDSNEEGSASGSRGGIEISESTEKALRSKVDEHNEKHGDEKGKRVDLGMLKAVYRRGAGAFSTSHRTGVGRGQWAMARVNAFLTLVRRGKPEDADYTTDFDLLPDGHPKKSDAKKSACGCGCDRDPFEGLSIDDAWTKALEVIAEEIDCIDEKNCGVGSEGFEEGNNCGGSSGGGGGSSESSSAPKESNPSSDKPKAPKKPRSSKPAKGSPPAEGMAKPQSHSVELPAKPSRITIDVAENAFRAMGYQMSAWKPSATGTTVTLKDDSGKESKLPISDAVNLIYANSSDPKANAAPAMKPKKSLLSDLWTKMIEADEIEPPHVLTKDLGKDALKEFDKITKREDELGKSVGRIFDRQVKAVLERIAKQDAPTQELAAEVQSLLESKKWRKEIVDALRPYLEDSLAAGIILGKTTLEKMKALPVNFDKHGEDLKAYARTESIRLANRAADSTNRWTAVKFSKVIGDGVANGETIPEIAERVKTWAVKDGDAERATTRRALTIARTEAQRASRRAEVEAWKASGVVTGKTWLLAPDPCEFCEAASDAFSKNAVGLDDSFYQKGDLLFGSPDKEGNRREMLMDYEDIDGPPLHPNCRCALQPRLDDEFEAEMQQAERELAEAEAENLRQIIAENAEEIAAIDAQVERIMR